MEIVPEQWTIVASQLFMNTLRATITVRLPSAKANNHHKMALPVQEQRVSKAAVSARGVGHNTSAKVPGCTAIGEYSLREGGQSKAADISADTHAEQWVGAWT